MTTRRTIVGSIDSEVLAFTVGKDPVLDVTLAEADCIGSAAHVTMLSRLGVKPRLFTGAECRRVVGELVCILREARAGRFAITLEDQDVHLAVERRLTRRLGDLGKRIHTARSRNDQVALDLRLYAKEQLLDVTEEAAALAWALLRFARTHAALPMVGRTHLQPAMPSSVGLWASSFAEGLLDDLGLVAGAQAFNDRCPLGSAAGYGVPYPIDRGLTSRLLGFAEPIHNVLYASQARGKCEAVVLSALGHVMITLARLSEDLILFSMPEFGYFRIPDEYCTGSSIMPQKHNPDVLELVRARSCSVLGHAATVAAIVNRLPASYNRDLQETKEPFLDGIRVTRACLRILRLLVEGLQVNRNALAAGFHAEVFAADRALELVGQGMSFRDAYGHVRKNLDELKVTNPRRAVAAKRHLGAPAGLDFALLAERAGGFRRSARASRKRFHGAVSRLLGVPYPALP
jgi:argininosuccinate lyase